ncbi:MAG: hypothetical protein ACXVBB_20985, partial [Isosphaeraceae bacterium]
AGELLKVGSAAKPDPKSATQLVFEPVLRTLTPVPDPYVPLMLAEGEEKTIDLIIENWVDEAPEGATLDWDALVSGKSVTAKAVSGEHGAGFLTVKGLGAGTADNVKIAVTVRYGSLTKTSQLRTFIFMVGPKVEENKELQDARMTDGGGVVSEQQLDSDVSDLLQDWISAAKTGVGEFATQELEGKIDALSAGSWASFIENLAGNVVWAWTVFSPAGRVAKLLTPLIKKIPLAKSKDAQLSVNFAISLAGIGVPAGLNLPSGHSEPTVSQTQIMLDDNASKWYQHMQKILAKKARDYVSKPGHEQLSRFQAIGTLAEMMFTPGVVQVDPKYLIKPTINGGFVAQRYRKLATVLLEKYVAQGKKTKLDAFFDEEEHQRIKENKPRQL